MAGILRLTGAWAPVWEGAAAPSIRGHRVAAFAPGRFIIGGIMWGVVKYLEIGLLTPPVGFNVYVVKSVVGDAVRLEEIFKGVLWFLGCEVIVMTLLISYPEISLFLPYLNERRRQPGYSAGAEGPPLEPPCHLAGSAASGP